MFAKLVASSLIGVGALGGVASVGIWYSWPKDLRDLLIKEGKRLLDINGITNDEEWQKLASKYQGQGDAIILEGNQKINRISGLEITVPNANKKAVFSELKKQCKKLFEKEISDKEEFKAAKENAINWCTFDSVVFKKPLITATGRDNTILPSSSLNSSDEQGSRAT